MDVTSFLFNLYRSYYAQIYGEPFAAKSLSNAPSLPHWEGEVGLNIDRQSFSFCILFCY